MRGVLATLSLISSFAALVFGVAYLVRPELHEVRGFVILLWAATLCVGLITGSLARRNFHREREGLGRSFVAIFFGMTALVVGALAFLLT